MILTLEVTGPQEGSPRAARRKVFQASGGTIGRLPDNDWVLAGSVRLRPACDMSAIPTARSTSRIRVTNGVFINSADNRLARGQLHT